MHSTKTLVNKHSQYNLKRKRKDQKSENNKRKMWQISTTVFAFAFARCEFVQICMFYLRSITIQIRFE